MFESFLAYIMKFIKQEYHFSCQFLGVWLKGLIIVMINLMWNFILSHLITFLISFLNFLILVNNALILKFLNLSDLINLFADLVYFNSLFIWFCCLIQLPKFFDLLDHLFFLVEIPTYYFLSQILQAFLTFLLFEH